jgi:hypothetical protein
MHTYAEVLPENHGNQPDRTLLTRPEAQPPTTIDPISDQQRRENPAATRQIRPRPEAEQNPQPDEHPSNRSTSDARIPRLHLGILVRSGGGI